MKVVINLTIEEFNDISALKGEIPDKDYELLLSLVNARNDKTVSTNTGSFYVEYGEKHTLIRYHSRQFLICDKGYYCSGGGCSVCKYTGSFECMECCHNFNSKWEKPGNCEQCGKEIDPKQEFVYNDDEDMCFCCKKCEDEYYDTFG